MGSCCERRAIINYGREGPPKLCLCSEYSKTISAGDWPTEYVGRESSLMYGLYCRDYATEKTGREYPRDDLTYRGYSIIMHYLCA